MEGIAYCRGREGLHAFLGKNITLTREDYDDTVEQVKNILEFEGKPFRLPVLISIQGGNNK